MKGIFINYKWFLLSIFTGTITSYLFCYLSFWYLIVIPGIFSGVFTLTMKKGIICGFLGVILGWTLYMIIGIVMNSTNILLDQIGALILGEGLGWLILLIIILIGALFGALGGAFGSGIMILIKGYENFERKK